MCFRRVTFIVLYLSVAVTLRSYAQDYAKFGQIALMRGKFKEAIRQLENAVKNTPNDTNVLWMLGYSYYSDGDYSHAMKTFDKLVAISPDDIKAYYQRGKSRQKIFENNKSLSLQQKENLLQDMIADYSLAIFLSRVFYTESVQNRGVAYRNYAKLKIESKSTDRKSILDLLKKSNDDFKQILEFRPARRDINELLRDNLSLMRNLR